MSRFETVMITGASSGLGAGLAQHYLAQNCKVILCGRNRSKLEGVVKGFSNYQLQEFNISDRVATENAITQVLSTNPMIDLILLNAGTHNPTDASEFCLDDYTNLIKTNLLGTLNCLTPLLKHMQDLRHGEIALMGSVAGYCGLPYAGAYCASKSALMRLAESMRTELSSYGITVRLISPGFVKTPLTDKNEFSMPFLLELDNAIKRITQGLEGNAYEIAFPKRLAWPLRLLSALPSPLFFKVAHQMLRRD